MSVPPTPAWPVLLSTPGTTPTSAAVAAAMMQAQPPPPPDSPSAHSDSDVSDSDDSDGDYEQPLSSEEIAAQEAQKDALKREFLRLARSSSVVTPFDAAASDDAAAIATLTLGQAHFKELLRSHITHAAGDDAAPDAAAMDAELSQLWLELPKVIDASGAEGVTFPSLVIALAGGANPSAQNSRRPSISQSESEAGLAVNTAAAPVAPWATHRKSASGSHSLLSPPTPNTAKSDVLRSMFAPVRRASFKHHNHSSLHAPPPGTAWRQKRHSDSARAGHAPSLLTSALANGTANGERPRANTYFHALESPSPNSAMLPPTGANSLPNSHGLLATAPGDFPAPPPATTTTVLSAPPPSRKAIANGMAAAAAASPTSADEVPAAFSFSSLLPSGCLDLAHPDWTNLSWLVQAQPAAFSAVVPATTLPGSPSNLGAQPLINPLLAPSSTLVSVPALQICMQHYLSRWLNQHELNVVSSLLKFVRGNTSAGVGKVAPSPDLLSYETLQKAVRCLHAAIRAQPEASVVDPLPSFAQALGLLSGASLDLAPSLTTEELLDHLNAFTVLAPESSLSLLRAFGPDVLHDAALQAMLSDLKALQLRHARLEKEHGMLGLSREQLDARNHALSEQVPQLQAQLAEAHRVNAGMQGEVSRAGEVVAQHIALQESYKTLAKRLAQLQEDHAALGDEVRLQREMAQSAEEEHALVAATLSRAKERVLALEREIKEMNNTHSQQRLNDQHSITTLNESLRTHQHQYHDLLEKSQIFYRRLVAVGETSGLEPLDGDDDNVLVGSLARTIARSQRPLGSSVINQDLDDSLGAELDDSARHEAVGRVQQQSQEIESLKRQMATLTMNKDREIDRLHGEIETLQNHGKNATRTPLGSGPSSDGEDASKALCCCTIM